MARKRKLADEDILGYLENLDEMSEVEDSVSEDETDNDYEMTPMKVSKVQKNPMVMTAKNTLVKMDMFGAMNPGRLEGHHKKI